MEKSGPLRHFVIAFCIAAAVYAIFYAGIEHRRTRRGPWHVTFQKQDASTPTLIITETNLNIENLKLTFPGQAASNADLTLIFDQPQPVPFDVPFGQCVFEDTTFQPGTIVFQMFGHEIQLLPRVLTIDKKEYPWKSDVVMPLPEVK